MDEGKPQVWRPCFALTNERWTMVRLSQSLRLRWVEDDSVVNTRDKGLHTSLESEGSWAGALGVLALLKPLEPFEIETSVFSSGGAFRDWVQGVTKGLIMQNQILSASYNSNSIQNEPIFTCSPTHTPSVLGVRLEKGCHWLQCSPLLDGERFLAISTASGRRRSRRSHIIMNLNPWISFFWPWLQ